MNLPSGLVVFSGPHCQACMQAKQWLRINGVPFHEIDVTRDFNLMQQLRKATGQATIPQFFHDGRWLGGGFSDVQRLVQRGAIR